MTCVLNVVFNCFDFFWDSGILSGLTVVNSTSQTGGMYQTGAMVKRWYVWYSHPSLPLER